MQTAVSPIISDLKDIKSKLENKAHDIIETKEQEILDYNRKNQLFSKGVDSNGQKLTPPYAESTKKKKQRKGLPTNRVTHYDTGKHYENFKIETRGKHYNVFADTKTNKGFDLGKHLNDRYGGKVYGLTKDNNDKINKEIILPNLIQWMYDQIKV
ncbi:hypothetical protein [Aquimarina sp. AU119]|uniref:hypothetical protein n=1 Tax=Aquimarina sp. AU119 TaxID=2108528 RepID=UPI000D694B3E|nr:hypothetical protein [Aquimarina sp. AU119]